MHSEYWIDIEGYEGLYQVSNHGRVKRLESFGRDGRKVKEKILALQDNNNGYKKVTLCKDDKKQHLVHKLVANAFLPNANNYPIVNHKDCNRSNNFVHINDDLTVDFEKSNIEWCTYQMNNSYKPSVDRKIKTQTNGKNSIPIAQYTLDGKFVSFWPSVSEIERVLNFRTPNIIECLKGRYSQSNNFVWKYIA